MKDKVVQYGEAEFLSGKTLEPRLAFFYEVRYDVPLKKEEVASAGRLPIPDLTREVMAAHTKPIYNNTDVKTEILDMSNASPLTEKKKAH